MNPGQLAVLDASVGVKWFKPESGSESALEVLARATEGELSLAAPVHFAHEVLSVVARHYSAKDVPAAWQRMSQAGITLVPLSDEIVEEAAAQADALDCSFYDALAPACAALLGATLYSADARAHGGYPSVVIIG
jgi:predicted nucleic acid-binding protein